MPVDAKVGDVVHVRGEVVPGFLGSWDDGSVRCVRFGSERLDFKDVFVPFTDIVHVKPRVLQVGDQVRLRRCTTRRGPVLGICRDKVWVDTETDGPLTYDVADLERVS